MAKTEPKLRISRRQIPPATFRLSRDVFAGVMTAAPELSPGDRRRRLRHHTKKHTLPVLKAQYSATRDPVFAWIAFEEARLSGLQTPTWVTDYLAVALRNLMRLYNRPPQKRAIAQAISDALGFRAGGVVRTSFLGAYENAGADGKKRGAYNPFKRRDHFSIAFSVFKARDQKHKLLHAYEEAARHHGVSRKTAEDAWAMYRDYLPEV